MAKLWRAVALACLLLGATGSANAGADTRIIGRWYGQLVLPGGELQQWVNRRRADETYRVEFRVYRKCRLVLRQIESGTWQYSDGILLQVATLVAGKSSNFVDRYRVVSLDKGRLEYIHVVHGVRYVARRVNDAFRFPGCNRKKGKDPLTS